MMERIRQTERWILFVLMMRVSIKLSKEAQPWAWPDSHIFTAVSVV